MLVSLPDGFHLHGFLNTNLARLLIEPDDTDCAFLIPRGSRSCIPEDLTGLAEWKEFPRHTIPFVSFAAYFLRLEATHRKAKTCSWGIIQRRSGWRRTWARRCMAPVAQLLAWCPALEFGLYAFERVIGHRLLRDVVSPDQFDTVVCGSAGIKALDQTLKQWMRRGSARRYGVVYSWDNLSSKSDCFCRFDRIAVWNNIMKRDAVELLGYDEQQVAVVGAPQFDIYHQYKPAQKRQAFLDSLRIPPDGHYVLYAGVPRRTTPWADTYIKRMLDALPDHYVLVRIHPQDHESSYAGVVGHERVRIVDSSASLADLDGRSVSSFRKLTGASMPQPNESGDSDALFRWVGFWLPNRRQAGDLADQLFHADAVVNVASTVTLEALRLGRPVINIGFDAEPGAIAVSMSEYYHTAHYHHVTDSGAVPIAQTAEEFDHLLQGIGQWWPQRHDRVDQLNRLIDPWSDGRATTRLADDILRFHQGN